jgi:predicted acetyltransferase
VLAQLLDMYAHELCAFVEVKFGSDGRFRYPELSLYWSESVRHPFLLTRESKLAGFALVQQTSQSRKTIPVWDMAEFFVLPEFRLRGIGRTAAHRIWDRFPGSWQVRVMESNLPGLLFWEKAILDYAGERISKVEVMIKGLRWRRFSFEVDAVADPSDSRIPSTT